MYRNMAASLIREETIRTTVPKAKELRRVVEPLITLAKVDGLANRRLAFDRLRDRPAVGKLFNDLGPRFKARPGGYLRILKMGFRTGDAAPMALVMLTDKSAAVSRGGDARDQEGPQEGGSEGRSQQESPRQEGQGCRGLIAGRSGFSRDPKNPGRG